MLIQVSLPRGIEKRIQHSWPEQRQKKSIPGNRSQQIPFNPGKYINRINRITKEGWNILVGIPPFYSRYLNPYKTCKQIRSCFEFFIMVIPRLREIEFPPIFEADCRVNLEERELDCFRPFCPLTQVLLWSTEIPKNGSVIQFKI